MLSQSEAHVKGEEAPPYNWSQKYDYEVKNLIQDVFKLKFDGLYLYEQYKEISWLKTFVGVINEYMQKKFLDNLKEYFSHKDIDWKWAGNYVIFYARYYLGIKRPLCDDLDIQDTESTDDENKWVFYDNFNHYDTGDYWDWKYTPNPFIGYGAFKAYLGFLMDYHQETWTIDYIMHLPERMLDNFNAWDIRVKITPLKIYFYMPIRLNQILRKDVTAFIAMTKTDGADVMNWPFGDCFEFRQGDHVEGIREKSPDLMLGDEIEVTEDPVEGFRDKP